jgi:hypothetical protein
MISVRNIPLNQLKISLLSTYKYQIQNSDFVDMISKVQNNQIDNITIQKGIYNFIKERKLDTDELFIQKGILTNETKDLIEITAIEFNNNFYVVNYEIIEKLTDIKYKGSSAQGYFNAFNGYKRFHLENEVDFEILRIHEMGFANVYPMISSTIIKSNNSFEIQYQDIIINDLRNPLVKEVKYQMNQIIENNLPEFLCYKGERVYVKQYNDELIQYLSNVISENNYYNFRNSNIELFDEIIYFDSSDIIARLITEYLIYQLKTNIISIKEMKNIIELVTSIEGMPYDQKIHVDNIMDKINNEIVNHPESKMNYYFTRDILDDSSNISSSTFHFKDRNGQLENLLIEIMGLSNKVKKVYIVSQYILMKYFSNDEQAKNDKKNRILNTMVNLSNRFKFDLNVVSLSKKQSDDFNIIQTNFQGIHGRYIIVISDSIVVLKLDAELDHFDDLDGSNVVFRDLAFMHIKDHRILPINIRKVVGELL